MSDERKKKASLFTLLRALFWTVGGFVFAVLGAVKGFVYHEYAQAAFYLAFSLSCDVTYFQLERRYDFDA